jgi:hypothetical protein
MEEPRTGPPPIGRAQPEPVPERKRRGPKRIALAVLYWLAVLIVSLAILVGLILLLESRDNSEIQSGAIVTSALRS